MPLRARGEGGGLRDLDLRASPCKNGIGENKGVVGVKLGAGCIVIVAMVGPESAAFSAGKAFHDEVTSKVFSTALRYLPTVLYCLVG